MNTQKMVRLAFLSAIAMILSYLESQLPSVGIPGVKLGLANAALIFALYRFSFREAILVSLVRVFVAGFLFGSPAAMLYSIAGAVLSMLVMTLLKKSGAFSTVGVSVAGGVAHNLGQILVAMAVLETGRLIYYLPVLVFSGLAGGIAIGLLGALLIKRIPHSLMG